MKVPKTICYQCKGFLNKEPTGPRTDVWYNHLCKFSPRDKRVEPATGKELYLGKNDLGGIYYTDDPYLHCRDINDGDCPKFQPADKKCTVESLMLRLPKL